MCGTSIVMIDASQRLCWRHHQCQHIYMVGVITFALTPNVCDQPALAKLTLLMTPAQASKANAVEVRAKLCDRGRCLLIKSDTLAKAAPYAQRKERDGGEKGENLGW